MFSYDTSLQKILKGQINDLHHFTPAWFTCVKGFRSLSQGCTEESLRSLSILNHQFIMQLCAHQTLLSINDEKYNQLPEYRAFY